MTPRLRRVLIMLASAVVAAVMVILGLWQMHSYEESTRDVSAERAAEAPVVLEDQVSDDGTMSDIYGKPVTLTGVYLPADEVLVGTTDTLRVVTPVQLTDGRYVAVVRGSVEAGSVVPPAPEGQQSFEGIFLASDKTSEDPATAGADMSTVRIQALAQDWPTPLLGGYVTLSEADSEAQGLDAASLTLPEAEGSATHRGYALQWWVFAAGAIAFGVYAARGVKDDDDAPPAQVDNPVISHT